MDISNLITSQFFFGGRGLDSKTNMTLTFYVLLEAEPAIEFDHGFVKRDVLSGVIVSSASLQNSV